MGVDSSWVLLDQFAWLDHSSLANKVLGAVVRDFYNPTTRKPDDPSAASYFPAEKDIIKREFTDFVVSNSATSATDLAARLTVLFSGRIVKATRKQLDLSAQMVELRRLDQNEDYWEKLRDDVALKRVLPVWLRTAGGKKYPQLCLVVGIATCEKVEMEWQKERLAEREAQHELPLDTIIPIAAGSPLPIPAGMDVKASIAKENTAVRLFKAKHAKRSIFALEIKVIERKGWTGVRYELGGHAKIEEGHELGDDDDGDEDDDELDMEDLVLHELKDTGGNPL